MFHARNSGRPWGLTRATGLFREIEIPVALEVFDAAVGAGRVADPDYESAGAEVDGATVAGDLSAPPLAHPASRRRISPAADGRRGSQRATAFL